MKLELCHADTCLPDYWGGHHRLHLSIPVWRGMTLQAIKRSLANELWQGAYCGSDDLIEALNDGDEIVYDACKAAIEALEPNDPNQTHFFLDLEETDQDDGCTVYAYFVFVEL